MYMENRVWLWGPAIFQYEFTWIPVLYSFIYVQNIIRNQTNFYALGGKGAITVIGMIIWAVGSLLRQYMVPGTSRVFERCTVVFLYTRHIQYRRRTLAVSYL